MARGRAVPYDAVQQPHVSQGSTPARMSEFFDILPDLYQRHVVDAGKQPQFFVLLAFLATFSLVRFITHSIRAGRRLPFIHNISAGGRHIHHLVPGIILLLITGYLGAALDPTWREQLAILFGIGAALTLDEFALWLNLEDVYWAKQGRDSIDAVVIFATLAGISVVGGQFFIEVIRELNRLVFTAMPL